MSTDADTIVIGAGAVGLATAREIAARGRDVLVLEKNDRSGQETTTRNSEVVHAGLYYRPHSLKARLCLAGNRMLTGFCLRYGVPFENRKKLVVATNEAEHQKLTALHANAIASGATGLELLDANAARAREPHLSCQSALLAHRSSVLDASAYVATLEALIAEAGGAVVHRATVDAIQYDPPHGYVLDIDSQGSRSNLRSKRLVIAAGHGSTALARSLMPERADRIPETYLAKGHYFALSGPAPFTHLIYPLPGAGSLGIHYTLTVAGEAKFGPDIEWVDTFDYRFDDPDGQRLRAFETSIRSYWPELPGGALRPAYTGLRPKLTRAGDPARDFEIEGPDAHGMPGLVALYGIESPGLTSSLAIAALVARIIESDTLERLPIEARA
ncbi:MAG: NAD(P)/FAD-dependent oxidoreductase [Hyphomicrobium sp.]|nr:NAD(P)/FAD-dependent oxidoreductase [Hyphomicrobium sp.]